MESLWLNWNEYSNLQCNDSDTHYIGHTRRTLKARFKEHLPQVARTIHRWILTK